MKKLLLFAMGAMMSMASFAQEEDVTYLIQNAGFDEDLTFQADGTMKEAISTTTALSDRSWAYIAADSTVYARPMSTSSQSRPDGRKLDAVNGFAGRIKGWTYIGADFPKCEWTYFGSVPYDLGETAVPIADDGQTYMAVPARPANGEFEPGAAFVYLRAGWGGKAIYKQEVSLPCAKYRVEYWTININANTTSTVTDLTQIVCRQDVFKDEDATGMQAQEWTKHEFEFTPTARFTMQFGYQAANAGSGGMPIVALDGIKLYKIGEADPQELIDALVNECDELAGQATGAGYSGLAGQIGDYSFNLEEIDASDVEAAAQAITAADAIMEKFRAALAEMDAVDVLLSKMDMILQTTNYAGKANFQAAYEKILNYKEGQYTGQQDFAAWILGAAEEGKAAIRTYYFSQEATVENPADYTFLIQNPWFIKEAFEPYAEGGDYIFPNADSYTEGSKNDDLTSEGWEVTGTFTGGDQRLNWQRNRSCWNAWGSGFTGTIAVGQTITDLPNGYYTVSADLITQSGCLNDQHVYAESTADKKISAALTTEGWDEYTWETVSMTAEQKVLVVDGTITIGAEGTGTGEGSAGWFLATNFKLNYLGEASAKALKAAYDAKVLAANELAAKMHFAADKKALNDVVAEYATTTDYIAALGALSAAIKEATKSEAKYEEYMEDGKTLPTIRETLKKYGGAGYKAGEEIAEFAYNFSMNWIAGETATYTKLDSIVNLTKNYVNTYIPVYNNADSIANIAKETGKAALQDLMAAQKGVLIAEMQLANVITEYVKALNNLMALVNKQNIYDDPAASDYTAYIINPNLEAEDGWNFERGNGDKNSTSGQWFDGSSTRYIDSYHSEDKKDPETEEVIEHIGLKGFKGWQAITEMPNGTYKLGVYVRTPAEGAYVFTSVADADTTFVEIPLDYYIDGEGVEQIASDTHGPIWQQAVDAIDGGLSETDPMYEYYSAIYNANSGNGRGWKHMEMDVVVANHQLTIGVKAGVADENVKVFGGNWFSAGGWTLTLVEKGNNDGWNGPIAEGVETVKSNAATIEGIFTLNGVRTNKLQRGLNIVIRNGKAQKIFVK